jgi:hypothetical protein
MNKQRPENSVTEMKMNWMLVSEWANQKLMQCKKCTTNTVKPAHDAAMESPECKYAYQSNKAFTMEWSHGHWPWPVWYLCHPVTWTNEMTNRNVWGQNESKVLQEWRVLEANESKSLWVRPFHGPWVDKSRLPTTHKLIKKASRYGASNEAAMILWFYEVPQ